MTEQEQNEHVWFREQIAIALAGGLDAAERVRFEAHAASCAACAAELAAARDAEHRMTDLFAPPVAGLEDRIIDRLRNTASRRPRIVIHPAVRNAAIGIAATIMLAASGYVVTNAVEQGQAPTVAANRTKNASNLRNIGEATVLYSNDN